MAGTVIEIIGSRVDLMRPIVNRIESIVAIVGPVDVIEPLHDSIPDPIGSIGDGIGAICGPSTPIPR